MSDLPQLLIFGEALVDRFTDALVPGGAPFNVARHLSAFGLPVLLLTRLGKDDLAAAIRHEMARYGLDDLGTQTDPEQPTGCVDVVESAPGRHSFQIAPVSAYDFYDAARLRSDHRTAGLWQRDAVAALYYGTLALRHERSRSACHTLLDTLPTRHFLDFNWRAGHITTDDAWRAFQRADTAKLNDEELAMLLEWRRLASPWNRTPPPDGASCEAIATLLAPTEIRTLVITYGAQGYAAFSRDGTCLVRGSGIPGVQVVDTVGAGDAFAAVTLLGSLLDWPLAMSLSRANAFAAAICAQRGAVPDSMNFYAAWKDRWQLPTPLTPTVPKASPAVQNF